MRIRGYGDMRIFRSEGEDEYMRTLVLLHDLNQIKLELLIRFCYEDMRKWGQFEYKVI